MSIEEKSSKDPMEKRETWVWLVFGGAISLALLWEASEVRVPVSEIFGISRSVFLVCALVVYAVVAVLFLTGLKWSKYVAFAITIICFLAGLAGGIWLAVGPKDPAHPCVGSMITLFSASLWSLAASVVFSPWPVPPPPSSHPPSHFSKTFPKHSSEILPTPSRFSKTSVNPYSESSQTSPVTHPATHPSSNSPSHQSNSAHSDNVSSQNPSSRMTGRIAFREIAETLDKFFPSMEEDDITSSMQVEAAAKICPSCSEKVLLESETCPGCGAAFPADYERDILLSMLADIGRPTSHRVSALNRLVFIGGVDQDLIVKTMIGELTRPAHSPMLRVELLVILNQLNKPLALEYARKMKVDHFQVVRRAAEAVLKGPR